MINSATAPDISSKIKRLIYRSWHRGCKETDEAFGPFATACLSTLPANELSMYEQLLEEDDWDIWNWLTGKSECPEPYQILIEKIKAHIKDQL